MELSEPWKLIKAGFWVGIGFIVPSIGVYILGTYLIYSMPSLWQPAMDEDVKETVEKMTSDADRSSQVRITQFRESKNGKQLLILGTVENTGESPVSGIRVEAELLDGNKQMVYECSEYIQKKLRKGEKENFQIRCGCGDQPVPEHRSATVRIVGANNF